MVALIVILFPPLLIAFLLVMERVEEPLRRPTSQREVEEFLGSATAGEVESAGAGRVVPPGDPQELLRAAEEMGADRRAASALGSHGPAYAAEHLSADTAMGRWDDLLRSLTQHVRR